MKTILKIGRRGAIHISGNTQEDIFRDAAEQYCHERDASGEGASTFPFASFTLQNKRYCISYNGCVWEGTERDLCTKENNICVYPQ